MFLINCVMKDPPPLGEHESSFSIICRSCMESFRKNLCDHREYRCSPFILWPDEGYIRPVTFWVVGDFDSPSGRQLLSDAIRHMVWDSSFHLFCDSSSLKRLQRIMSCGNGLIFLVVKGQRGITHDIFSLNLDYLHQIWGTQAHWRPDN